MVTVRLTMERDEYQGRSHWAIVYRVIGLPRGRRATIESQTVHDDRWTAERLVEGFRYMGEYLSAEAALAAIQTDGDAEGTAAAKGK